MPSQATMVLVRGTDILKSLLKSSPPTCVWALDALRSDGPGSDVEPQLPLKRATIYNVASLKRTAKIKPPKTLWGPRLSGGRVPGASRSQGMAVPGADPSLLLMDAAVALCCDTDNPQRRNPLAQKVTGKDMSKCDSENHLA